MDENWHDVWQGLNRQLEMERKMATIRRQKVWAERKAKFESKVQAIVAHIQFSLTHQFEEIK